MRNCKFDRFEKKKWLKGVTAYLCENIAFFGGVVILLQRNYWIFSRRPRAF